MSVPIHLKRIRIHVKRIRISLNLNINKVKHEIKSRNCGKYNNDLKIKHFKDLFGLESTKYLKKNRRINMPINWKTGKNKAIAFVLFSRPCL